MISYSGVGRGSVFAPFSSPPAPTSSFAGSMRRISSWIDGAGGRVPIAAANLSKTSVVMDVGVDRVVIKRERTHTGHAVQGPSSVRHLAQRCAAIPEPVLREAGSAILPGPVLSE